MEVNRFFTIVSEKIGQEESHPGIAGSRVGDKEYIFGIEHYSLIICHIITTTTAKYIGQNFSQQHGDSFAC